MLEISPVLAGKYDPPANVRKTDLAPGVVPWNPQMQQLQPGAPVAATSAISSVPNATNPTASTPDTSSAASSAYNVTPADVPSGTEDAYGVDARRYTKFDHSASDAGSTTDFSFGDFLDMLNPLQHIPVISSIYREVTGEKINPVARVTGDIMYGAAMGIGSAILGGLGAATDAAIESQTGKDTTGAVVASLFGPDDAKTAPVQLAAASTPTAVPAAQVASLAPATASPATVAAATTASGTAAPPTLANAKDSTSDRHTDPMAALIAASSDPTKSKSLMAPTNKLPFGGAIANTNMQQQNMDMALAAASPAGMRVGHTLYTSRLMNGSKPLPVATTSATSGTPTAPTSGTVPPAAAVAPTAPVASAAPPVTPKLSALTLTNDDLTADAASQMSLASGDSKIGPQKNAVPQSLVDDMMMLKALKQYKNVATGPQSTGAHVDVTN